MQSGQQLSRSADRSCWHAGAAGCGKTALVSQFASKGADFPKAYRMVRSRGLLKTLRIAPPLCSPTLSRREGTRLVLLCLDKGALCMLSATD